MSGDMINWWDKEIGDRRMSSAVEASISAHPTSTSDTSEGSEAGKEAGKGEDGKSGESAGSTETDAEQPLGDGKLPGPGGT